MSETPSQYTASETPKASSPAAGGTVKGDSPRAGHGATSYTHTSSPGAPARVMTHYVHDLPLQAAAVQGESAAAYDSNQMAQRKVHEPARLSPAYREFLLANGLLTTELKPSTRAPASFTQAETPRPSSTARGGVSKGDSPPSRASSYTRSDSPQVQRQSLVMSPRFDCNDFSPPSQPPQPPQPPLASHAELLHRLSQSRLGR